MVNIGTRVTTLHIVFYTSKNAVPIERKMLQDTILSIKLHHCTWSELETHAFTLPIVLACLSMNCADQKQHFLGFRWILNIVTNSECHSG